MSNQEPLPADYVPHRPAVLDVHKVALQEIDVIVGNEMSLGPEECSQIRGVLSAALSEKHAGGAR